MNVETALSTAYDTLSEKGIADPRRQAASLLSLVTGRPHSFLIAHPEYELGPEEFASFEQVISRRAEHEPFQYISGVQEFYGLDFSLTPDVLIPRPETEFLVESAIAILAPLKEPRFLEIGVGSGCISVAILKNVATARAIAVDISSKALEVATQNALSHGVEERIELIESDIFENVEGRFDLIVSNPPYVAETDISRLQSEVRDYEPRIALDGGTSGLDAVRRLINGAPDHLRTHGSLLIEIGYAQAELVADLFISAEWKTPIFIPDLQQIPRVVRAELAA